MAVIQITDTDGVFIDDSFVVVDEIIAKRTVYCQDEIKVSSEDQATNIKQRNKEKSAKVRMMISTQKLHDFPYYLLYFSCNLDHVIHGDCNVPENEKSPKAKEFSDQFRQKPDSFRSFFTDGAFVVDGTYQQTWDFIQNDKNSLHRHSNFQLMFEIMESLL